MKKKRIFQERKKAGKEKGFFFSLLVGCVGFFVLGLSLLALFCFPALMMEDPMKAVPVCALIALLICSWFGGNLCARTYGKKGMLCGASCSLIVLLMILTGGFLLHLTIRPILFGVCAPLITIISCVGGMFGANREKTHRPKHKIRF